MRVEQPAGRRGSLKWIQQAVEERWDDLERPIVSALGGAEIEWVSPLRTDSFAEYRDASFLNRLALTNLTAELASFWPARGPQWDALGRSSRGDLLLVEAKAHVAEMCSPGTAAGPTSRARSAAALEAVAEDLGAAPDRAPWTDHFYQLANRLAHLHFLRARGVPAWLVLVGFLGDADMRGPASPEAWDAAYHVAFDVMGLPARHKLSRYVLHVTPGVPAVGQMGDRSHR
jgi:hypothetical protein